MSCTSETYSSTVDLRPPLYMPDRSGDTRPRVTEPAGKIRPRALEPAAAHASPDSTNADPEHIWGDEGPVNE